MKRQEKLPDLRESRQRLEERGEVHCNACRRWVLQSGAHWQHRCASAWVWTCGECIRSYYDRYHREVPEAVHRLEKVAPPSDIRSLWEMEDGE